MKYFAVRKIRRLAYLKGAFCTKIVSSLLSLLSFAKEKDAIFHRAF